MPTREFRASRRSFALFCGVGALLAHAPSLAQPSTFPQRPVRLVIPFGPGGIADIHSRVLAENLSRRLGQQVYVENQAGGLGIPAARTVMASPPDGHTLALFANGTATSVSLVKNLTFDPIKDFAPISNVVEFDFLMAVSSSSEFKKLETFIAAARQNPGALRIGTTARGSSSNLAAELLKLSTGVDITVVPYRNPADLIVALRRNDVAMVLDTYALLKPMFEDSSAIAIASTGAKRSGVLPQTPTAQEVGVGGYEVSSWNGIFAPANTPQAAIDRLNREINAVLSQPEVRQKLLGLGLEAAPSSPAKLGSRLAGDIEKWARVIAHAGIEKQ